MNGDRLDKLERDLYDPKKKFEPVRREPLASVHRPAPVSQTWKRPIPPPPAPPKKKSLLDKILIGSVVFALLAGAASIGAWFFELNSVSAEKIKLEVEGESRLKAGEETELKVRIANNNDTDIESGRIILSYPAGTRVSSEDGSTETAVRTRHSIGVIKTGQQKEETFSFTPFGEKGEKGEVLVRFEYMIPGSSASFAFEEVFSYEIESSPVTLRATLPDSVAIDTPFSFTISLSPESTLEDVSLVGVYPSGFEFESASVEPVSESRVWHFARLGSRERKEIEVRGTMSGASGERKTFEFQFGVPSSPNSARLTSVYAVETLSTTLSAPPVELSIELPSSRVSGGAISGSGELPVSLYWKNNTSRQITNVEIELEIEGSGYDPDEVTTRGRYLEREGVIRWTSFEEPSLEPLISGESGTADARIGLRPQSGDGTALVLRARIRGNDGSGQRTISDTEIPLRFAGDAALETETLRTSGSMSASGPYPPRVGQESEFILSFSPSSALSSLSSARVTATLPPYVVWKNSTSASQGSVSFNQSTREVTWNLGLVASGAGTLLPAPTLYALVSFTPSTQHVDDMPDLATNIVLAAREDNSGDSVRVSGRPLTTRVSGDANSGTVRN